MAKNKDNKTWPLLIGAIGFGIAAALLSVLYLKSREAAIRASLEGPEVLDISVVVAKSNLAKGQQINADLFAVRKIPENFVHQDAVSPNEFNNYLGRSLTASLGSGKALLKSFMDESFPIDFSDIIPMGQRAMTITVDDVNSIGGHLRPGNYIDLFVNIPMSFDTKSIAVAFSQGLNVPIPEQISDIIPAEFLNQVADPEVFEQLLSGAWPKEMILPVVQNVRVLATGKDPYEETLDQLRQPQRRREGHFSNITVQVNTEQAAFITLALDKGELLALLRNRNDDSASNFTYVAIRDLLNNASEMAEEERQRNSRADVAAGVDASGNLVDANGKILMSRDQLAAAGYIVNENGQIVDKDGNVIDANDIVIGPDGSVMTKQQLAAAGFTVNASGQIVDANGNVVSASDIIVAADGTIMTTQQLAAAGLSFNEKGDIVDSQGRVVSPDDIIVTADGTVISKQQLAAAGMSINEKGEIVDKNGNVISKEEFAKAGFSINENGDMVDKNGNIISPEDVVVTKDGKVMSKQQLAAAGLTINENGEIVDENGNVVDPKDIVIAANGSIMTKQQLAKAGLSINENGEIIDENGNVISPDDVVVASDGSVMTKQQLAAAGLSINQNGQIVDADGNVVDPNDLITGPDGTVLSKQQLAAAGLRVNDKGEIVDSDGNSVSSKDLARIAKNTPITGTRKEPGRYDLIIGGASKEGVAKVQKLSIAK